MTDQLFRVAEKLSPRQQLVYDACALRPMNAHYAGVLLHTNSNCRFCTPDQACQFAERNGREVLEALRKKGLLRRDREHTYRRDDGASADPESDGYDPATAPIPF